MTIYWISGNTRSGKTTLGSALTKSLRHAIHLDGDELRRKYNLVDLSVAGREKLNKLAVGEAIQFRDKGFDVVVSTIAPTKKIRDSIRRAIPDVRFIFLPGGSPDLKASPYEIPKQDEWFL
jgi:adenylylsulfate kinase-like enzyme